LIFIGRTPIYGVAFLITSIVRKTASKLLVLSIISKKPNDLNSIYCMLPGLIPLASMLQLNEKKATHQMIFHVGGAK
jgi:hypothetical protein